MLCADSIARQEEEWFGVKYIYEPISSDVVAAWSNCGVNAKLRYQDPNPFIPTDLSLVPLDSNDDLGNAPRRIHGDAVWYHSGAPFRTPRAHVVCYVANPNIVESAKSMMASELYLRLVKDSLNAYSYHAQVAQLTFDLHVKEAGFELFACGFNDKLPQLVRVMVNQLVALDLIESRFDVIKEELVRQYQNALHKGQTKAKFLRLHLLIDTSFSHQELVNELVPFTVQDMRAFIAHDLWRLGARVVGMVHGNLSKANAIELIHGMSATIANVAPPVAKGHEWVPRLVRAIAPSSNTIVWDTSEHDQDVNTVCEFYFQMTNHTIEGLALADLLHSIMEEPLFDVLRTQKQLGYEVSCTVRVTHGILGFGITVVSSSTTSASIAAEIDAFLDGFRQTLNDMPASKFQAHVDSQVQLKLEPDVTMMAATDRFWTEISTQRWAFDLNKDLATWLQSQHCTKPKLIRFFSKWFGPTARKLQVRIVGQNASTRQNDVPPATCVRSSGIVQLKASLALHNESKTINTKYPDENEFEAYLSTHGGYTNATTDCESTSFVFEVNAAGFEHALDMFANFFVAPLLHVNAMERELCAIASDEKARHLRLLVLDSTAVETHGICAAVEAMSASTLASFVKSDMFTNARITGFFHGNVDDTCAEAMWALVKQHVATATARSSDAPSIHTLDKKPHALVLPTSPLGRGILVRQPSEHVEEVNSFVEIYYQLGVRDIASNAYANLIQHIMNEPLYSTLRSRDQMGYDVGCCVRNTHGVLGFSISVQSSAYSASEIALRLDKFVHVDFPYVLESLDDDTFEAHVAARKAAWHHAHRANLDTATSLYWDEIISQRFEFNSRDLFLDVLSTVTKADCIARYHEWFVVAATRKKMRVHVVGQNHRATHTPFESIVDEDVAPAVVTDLAEFKRSRPSIHRACGPTWSV
ncbi:hypothetical protein DYB32_000554 [Aphanomyces invadans]|uniref:Peptidase M16 middle/third domain-containing protein n=1 Tax=Aphanomyces invadans TaxID=157072 RepID=A0A418B9L3_9STRA|nr:hypothetical protein DYB32_000554 [Aphanomyces invadans]